MNTLNFNLRILKIEGKPQTAMLHRSGVEHLWTSHLRGLNRPNGFSAPCYSKFWLQRSGFYEKQRVEQKQNQINMRCLLVALQWLKEADKTSIWIIFGRRFSGLLPYIVILLFSLVSPITKNGFSRKWAMGFSNVQYKMLWPISIHFSLRVKL